MTPKELYGKYKGRKASCEDCIGIICGYDANPNCVDAPLIMAISKDPYGRTGWLKGTNAVKVTHTGNPDGYLWVNESDILPEEKPSLWSRIMKSFLGR